MTPSPVPAVGERGRAVMFVRNDVTTDARVLREAAALRDAGWAVTIIGLLAARSALPVAEERDAIAIRRIPGPTAWREPWRLLRDYPWRLRGRILHGLTAGLRAGPRGWPRAAGIGAAMVGWVPWSVVRVVPYLLGGRRPRPETPDDDLDWLARWRWSIVGWGKLAGASAPPADVYHGHDLAGLPAALAARQIHGGRVVYDSHEIFTEAAGVARRPRWARWVLARAERRMASGADAIVTVNEGVAVELTRRLGAREVTVVHNCPPRPQTTTDVEVVDHLRAAAGLATGTPVALYHGAFLVERGMEQLAQAILQPGLESIHAVYLGYGNARPMLERMVSDPRFGGRLHVLDAVPPDDLDDWLRTADVGVMPIQPTTLNHRHSTPNKLFECLAAGVPVVASDFPAIRRIVLDDDHGPLGELCDPSDPASIAAAIGRILALSPEDRTALRERCLRAARTRWNWETESAALIDLYDRLVDRRPGRRPPPDEHPAMLGS